MASEAQKRANAKYAKEKCKTVCLRFFPADMELYEHLQRQENKNGYIKELIKRDMVKQWNL